MITSVKLKAHLVLQGLFEVVSWMHDTSKSITPQPESNVQGVFPKGS